jgi:hypothetical protein
MNTLNDYRLRALEEAVALLQASMPKQHEPAPTVPKKLAADLVGPYRYFTDGYAFWKMPPDGKGFVRLNHTKEWNTSILNLAHMGLDGEIEITKEEGEP